MPADPGDLDMSAESAGKDSMNSKKSASTSNNSNSSKITERTGTDRSDSTAVDEGQQVSVKSASATWKRFSALLTDLTPANVLLLKVDDMRGAGLSARKVDYLVDLALHFTEDRLHVQDWERMDDEAIIAELTAIRGIGRWTAEMFLIFYLLRPNVLPLDDAGLLKGISESYFSGDPVSRSDAREVAEAWKPWCTVATWYIWRSLDPQPVAY